MSYPGNLEQKFPLFRIISTLWLIVLGSGILSNWASAEEIAGQAAAVLPTVGTVNGSELKICVVEIREQLRFQGYQPVVQKDVRNAMAALNFMGKPTANQLVDAANLLQADLIFVSVVSEAADGEFYLDVAAMKAVNGSSRAVRIRLPSRGAAPYESKQFLPAAAAAVASLLDKDPHPVHGPFPAITILDPGRLIRKETPSPMVPAVAPPPAKVVTSPPPQKTDPVATATTPSKTAKKDSEKVVPEAASADEAAGDKALALKEADAGTQKKPYNWKKWDHAGLFGELGFMFSWCRRGAMCETTTKGYGGRIRLGVRIASFVALSFSAFAVDHQMPITTDTEVFLNVAQAFVYTGVFGGLRVHPVRRFPVDPYVGVDFGYSWLLYAENVAVAPDPSIPEEVSDQFSSLINVRRETIYLKGFTVTPELGINFFVAPALAFGIHVQWILPYWKDVCSRVYNPGMAAFNSAPQICALVEDVGTTAGLDEKSLELLSKKDDLPRFISLELDLTFVFK